MSATPSPRRLEERLASLAGQSLQPERSTRVATPLTASLQNSPPPEQEPAPGAQPHTPAVAPLAKPTVRVQGSEIIIEDAGSPPHTAQHQGFDISRTTTATLRVQPPASRATPPVSRDRLLSGSAAEQPPSNRPLDQQQQQRPAVAGASAHREPGPASTPADPGSAARAAAAALLRPYNSTLTEENVAYLNKLDQVRGRGDAAERLWRWLDGAGPPYDVEPSMGLTPKVGGPPAARPSEKRRSFCCFGCFRG